MQAVISVGVAYTQLLEDVRDVIRYELQQSVPLRFNDGVPPSDELLTVREAAELLDITIQTVHDWKKRGLLKYHKLGSRTYFKRADVLAALQGHQRNIKAGKK